MIKAEGLVKRYGDTEVLKGIDLELKSKEVVAIVGASGAGKTTLLQILGTLDLPNAGSLIHGSTNLLSLGQKELAKFRNKNIGFIFQFHQLLPEFTALENVCLPALIGGKSLNEARKRGKELLGSLGLENRISHKPAELSGGERQRVAAARALMNEPDLILADEPSGNLDSNSADELHELFFTLRKDYGQTFVIVTHNNELANMADRKLEMADGKLVNS